MDILEKAQQGAAGVADGKEAKVLRELPGKETDGKEVWCESQG